MSTKITGEHLENARGRGFGGPLGRANLPKSGKATEPANRKAVDDAQANDYKDDAARVHVKGLRDPSGKTTGLHVHETSRDNTSWTSAQKKLRGTLAGYLSGNIEPAEFRPHLAEVSHLLAASLFGSNDELNAFAASTHQNTEFLAFETAVKELVRKNSNLDIRIKLTAYIHAKGHLKGNLKAARVKILVAGTKVFDLLTLGGRNVIDKDEARSLMGKIKGLSAQSPALPTSRGVSALGPPTLNAMKQGQRSFQNSKALTDVWYSGKRESDPAKALSLLRSM
jgi:hypothetical protein